MREIKFRAWNEVCKKMVMPLDIVEENELMVSMSGKVFEEHNNYACGDPDCCGANENYLQSDFDNRYRLMQYTGLKDKNGKEIYEADILRNSNGTLSRVSYLDYRFTTTINEEEEGRELLNHKTREVIGNIYENPELLKGGE